MDIFLRFRSHKVALAADIEKAFLMISMAERDRDALRFLWVDDVSKAIPNVSKKPSLCCLSVTEKQAMENTSICSTSRHCNETDDQLQLQDPVLSELESDTYDNHENENVIEGLTEEPMNAVVVPTEPSRHITHLILHLIFLQVLLNTPNNLSLSFLQDCMLKEGKDPLVQHGTKNIHGLSIRQYVMLLSVIHVATSSWVGLRMTRHLQLMGFVTGNMPWVRRESLKFMINLNVTNKL